MKKTILLLLFLSIFTRAINFTKEEFFSIVAPPLAVKSFFDEHKQTILKIKKLIEQFQRPSEQEREEFKNSVFCSQYTVYSCFNFSLMRGLIYMVEEAHAAQLIEKGLFSKLRMADCYLYQSGQATALTQDNYVVIIEKIHKNRRQLILGKEHAQQLTEFFLLLGIKPKEIAFDIQNDQIIICRLFWNESTDADKSESVIIDALFRPHRIFKQYAPYVVWNDEARSYLNELKNNPPSREVLLEKYNVTEQDLRFPDIDEIKAFLG